MFMEIIVLNIFLDYMGIYLYDIVFGVYVCINIDIIRYFRERWSVIICIYYSNIDNNWFVFLYIIKCCYFWR